MGICAIWGIEPNGGGANREFAWRKMQDLHSDAKFAADYSSEEFARWASPLLSQGFSS